MVDSFVEGFILLLEEIDVVSNSKQFARFGIRLAIPLYPNIGAVFFLQAVFERYGWYSLIQPLELPVSLRLIVGVKELHQRAAQ